VGDPELDQMLKRFLAEAAAERQTGVTLSTVHKAVTDLAGNFAEHVAEDRDKFAKNDERWGKFRQWRARLLEHWPGPHRPPMGSISGADDSGSFELGALGARAKFTGKWPVTIGLALLVMAASGFVGAVAHAAFSRSVTVAPAQPGK
jgi:hypothetical protein